ncbi:phage tail protein [Methylomonas sp. EFPC3]|uniref:phage tail protein n=1 Tax=Methylomonas sp. EFPC3 TaxID=3021710 RepID=UPI00241604A3|nr:phage tail protein [Methylomonas sp. EFPC3]WFP52147.1 phage tail protein [Methylomonas sp. EFPC3]
MKTASRFISVVLGALMASSASAAATEDVVNNSGLSVYYEFSAGGISTYFTDCKGMGSQNEVEQTRVNPREESTTKLPGRLQVKNLTCSRGLTKSMDLWNWRQQVASGRSARSRVDATLIAYDQTMTPIAEWSFSRVWPASIDFNDTTPGRETIVFAADQVQRLR